jgi:hypothetical protein
LAKRELCYVAAPYSAPTAAQRRVNVARARAIGILARHDGFVPIVPHVMGADGLFGSVEDDGRPSDERTETIALCCELASRCERMYVLTRDDASMSEGCAMEREAWWTRQESGVLLAGTWATWLERIAPYPFAEGALWENCEACVRRGIEIGESCLICRGEGRVSLVDL